MVQDRCTALADVRLDEVERMDGSSEAPERGVTELPSRAGERKR